MAPKRKLQRILTHVTKEKVISVKMMKLPQLVRTVLVIGVDLEVTL